MAPRNGYSMGRTRRDSKKQPFGQWKQAHKDPPHALTHYVIHKPRFVVNVHLCACGETYGQIGDAP